MDYTRIRVTCVGPAGLLAASGRRLRRYTCAGRPLPWWTLTGTPLRNPLPEARWPGWPEGQDRRPEGSAKWRTHRSDWESWTARAPTARYAPGRPDSSVVAVAGLWLADHRADRVPWPRCDRYRRRASSDGPGRAERVSGLLGAELSILLRRHQVGPAKHDSAEFTRLTVSPPQVAEPDRGLLPGHRIRRRSGMKPSCGLL